jgi:hypothetical protein
VGTAVSVPAADATAVPLNGIDRLGFEALDVTVTVPGNVPVEVGANVTVKVVLCPGVNVTGGVIPLRLNPGPLIPTREIVTPEPPVLVTVSDRDRLPPTVTLPKLRLVGVDVT